MDWETVLMDLHLQIGFVVVPPFAGTYLKIVVDIGCIAIGNIDFDRVVVRQIVVFFLTGLV